MDDVLKGTSKPTATKREHRRSCRAWRDGPRRAAVTPSIASFATPRAALGADSYTLAVGHKEGAHFVIDLVRGTSGKFDPDIATQEYAALLREYSRFPGDRRQLCRIVGSWCLAQGRHRLFQV